MALNTTVLKQVKESGELRAMLALELNKSIYTIDRYVKSNKKPLASPTALKVITKYLNITRSEALQS